MRFVAIMAFVSGCTGVKGDIGPAGAAGPMGNMGDPGKGVAVSDLAGLDLAGVDGGLIPPQGVTCNPGEFFCVGNRLANCLLSGADATISSCDSIGTPTNPASCVTTGCPVGQKACCLKQLPIIKWNWTAPTVAAGQNFTFAYDGFGNAPTPCAQDSKFVTSWTTMPQVCPSSAKNISISFARTILTVGMTTTLPSIGVTVGLSDSENGAPVAAASCNTWTGTIRFDSDVPAWSVTLDLTCDDTLKPGLKIGGTLSGNL